MNASEDMELPECSWLDDFQRDPIVFLQVLIVIVIGLVVAIAKVPVVVTVCDPDPRANGGGGRGRAYVGPGRPERPADAALGERAEDCVTCPGRRGVCLCVWSMS